MRQEAKNLDILLQLKGAEAHHQQLLIERGDGILKVIFKEINKEIPEAPLNMKVVHAVFGKKFFLAKEICPLSKSYTENLYELTRIEPLFESVFGTFISQRKQSRN